MAGQTLAPPVCEEGCSAQQGEPGAPRRVPTPPVLRGPRGAMGRPKERGLSRDFWSFLSFIVICQGLKEKLVPACAARVV